MSKLKYRSFKTQQQTRLSELPIRWAFNKNQLDKIMEETGWSTKDMVALRGGGVTHRQNLSFIKQILDEVGQAQVDAFSDDDFLLEAIVFELSNHEYIITQDCTDVVQSLDLDIKNNERHRILLVKGIQKYEEEMDAVL